MYKRQDRGPVDPDAVWTVRVIDSGGDLSRTDGVSTRVDRLTATGAPAPSAANLSWNYSVNICPSLAPSSSVVRAVVLWHIWGTLSTMAPSSEGASGERDFCGLGFGRVFVKRGLAVFIVTPTLLSRAPPGSTIPFFNGSRSFSTTPSRTGPCGPT